MKKMILCTFMIFLMSFSLLAQSGVGKLAGKIVDANTKEPLVGANVVILGTELGAAADINGNYFVLNITPGTYDVRVSYVGYAQRIFKDVRVVANITYQLDVELTTDFSLPEIVVQSKKFFEEKSTNTTKVIDAETINRIPVKGVENLASLNAGVVISDGSGGASGNATINVRGGRGGEVLYIVDGVPQNDIYTGVNYSQVSNSAVEQISFQIGGYEAKYGQAQSGIVNVTTKSGSANYTIFGDVLSSSFTDDYGYNLYTLNFGGPFIPGDSKHTFFVSGERGWFADGNPKRLKVEFKSIDKKYDNLPYNDASVDRYTIRTTHNLGEFALRLGANINNRFFRSYTHTYAKWNAHHNPRVERTNQSYSAKISHNFSSNSFWNLNLGFKNYKNVQGDGLWFDDLYAYGDSARIAQVDGATISAPGGIVQADANGMFFLRGRVSNLYTKTDNTTLSGDFDFTSQQDKHLLEFGGGLSYNLVRYYAVGPRGLSSRALSGLPDEEKFKRLRPTAIGFDVTGQKKTDKNDKDFGPRNPVFGYLYLQDRFELSDMVLNIGLRFDYFDTKADILKDPKLPYGGGSDPNAYDAGDFVTKEVETYFSPRIGLGFPVTQTTVFHAQFGRFIQAPSLDQLYTTVYDLDFLITDNNWSLNTGHVSSEVTTQYEIGFRQILGNVAALNITAFYKNTRGLINTSTVFFQRSEGGEVLRYITPTNTDFGTIKGLAMSLDLARMGYFSMSLDYTYSLAEGTGSSTSSSFIAAFRNVNGEIPKVIAPLDFDQRHTGVVNVDFFIPKGDMGWLEMVSANVLVRFNSGRPYTPLLMQNLLAGSSNWGDTKGYVNSAYGPGNFRVDLKVEKTIDVGSLSLTPYLWIENLFDGDNPVSVYRSTGDPYTTGWLSTAEGLKFTNDQSNPESFKQDYISLERNPANFGIPRLIKLGFKVNFTTKSN